MPEVHLYFHGLEIICSRSSDLAAHPLFAPLSESIELLVDIHRGRMRVKEDDVLLKAG